MPISFVTASCTPRDNGTLAGSVVSASAPLPVLNTGSLVVLVSGNRLAGTHTINSTGGQTWTRIHDVSDTVNFWWTRFNGMWSGSVSTSCTATTCRSTMLLAFSSSGLTYNWGVESSEISGSLSAAGAGPYNIPGRTTSNASSVTIALWSTADDNSWTAGVTSSDGGWLGITDAPQYRNLASTDASYTFAYNIRTSAGIVGAVSRSQHTVTNDATTYELITFYEFIPSTSRPTFIIWNHDE